MRKITLYTKDQNGLTPAIEGQDYCKWIDEIASRLPEMKEYGPISSSLNGKILSEMMRDNNKTLAQKAIGFLCIASIEVENNILKPSEAYLCVDQMQMNIFNKVRNIHHGHERTFVEFAQDSIDELPEENSSEIDILYTVYNSCIYVFDNNPT